MSSVSASIPKIGFIIPCYNEAAIIEGSILQFMTFLSRLIQDQKVDKDSFFLFVDDGSTDQTWNLLLKAKKDHERLKLVRLSRNFGHQNALLAGLETALDLCDATLCMDADMQHDISVIPEFLNHFTQGCEIVYGVKRDRSEDSFFKKHTALTYYRLMRLFRVPIIFNHADFRLMSKRALADLLQYRETNLFLRGIIPQLGYKTGEVFYDVQKRQGGDSKYTLGKMLSLAWDGITSFSRTPLRMVSAVGFLTVILSLLLTFYSLFDYFTKKVVPGWSSVIISIYFLGGIQLLAVGVIGEYLGKIYLEVKKRPRYLIEQRF